MTTPDSRSGEDTFDLIDDAVAVLADRRGEWLGYEAVVKHYRDVAAAISDNEVHVETR